MPIFGIAATRFYDIFAEFEIVNRYMNLIRHECVHSKKLCFVDFFPSHAKKALIRVRNRRDFENGVQ